MLAQHEWKKHNGSALWVSYDTKDIEDEYYAWEYHAFDRNDTKETTQEKWEKKCLVPNQKRHRFMNKGAFNCRDGLSDRYRYTTGLEISPSGIPASKAVLTLA